MGRRRHSKKRSIPSGKTIVFSLVIVAAVVAVGYTAVRQAPALSGGQSSSSAWVGRQAPDFTLPTVNGSTFRLGDYLGKGSSVLLFFHEGLSCSPCLQQTVDLDHDYTRSFNGLNLKVVAITTDSISNLGQWTKLNGISHLFVLSDHDLVVDRMYNTLGNNVSMMPGTSAGHTFVLVNPQGTISWRADYGPGTMYVPASELVSSIKNAIQ